MIEKELGGSTCGSIFLSPSFCVLSSWWQRGEDWVSAESHAMVDGLPDASNITPSPT